MKTRLNEMERIAVRLAALDDVPQTEAWFTEMSQLVADAQQAVVESQKSVAAMQDDLRRMVARAKRYETALRIIHAWADSDGEIKGPREEAMADIKKKAADTIFGG